MLLAELLKRVMRQLCVVLAAFLDARPVTRFTAVATV